MARQRGMHAIKPAVEENKRSQRSGSFFRRFKLEDGQSAQVLFISDASKEPFISPEHSFRDKKQFSSIVHRDEDCVACYVNDAGDRRVSRVSHKGCFSLYDLRWARKVINEELSKERQKDIYDYKIVDPESMDSDKFKSLKRKGKIVRMGRCGWDMSNQWMNAILSINAQAGKRCKSCVKGKITRVGIENAEGKKIKTRGIDEEVIERKLAAGKWVEVLECSKCDDPVRMSIFNSIVTVTRTGKDTNTTYQFSLDSDDIPKDVQELLESKDAPEPYDWDAIKAEPSTGEQARRLGVRDPFGRGKRDAEDYDDDDDDDDDDVGLSRNRKARRDDEEDEDDIFGDPFGDEDDEDSDDDDDEDEPKKKKKKKGNKVKVKKKSKSSDDDDYEDEDDDEDD